MDENSRRTSRSERRIERRRFIGGGLALTSAALAAACIDNDGKKASRTTVVEGTGPAASTATVAPVRGGVVRRPMGNAFDSTDVHRAVGTTHTLANLVYNKLVMYRNPDTGEIEPDLAERYETPDASTYTFRLRRNVTWHPPISRELTADDVRWHIERQAANKLLDDGPASFFRTMFHQAVTRIETPDRYTVHLTLNGPTGVFLDGMAVYLSTIPNRETTERFEATHRILTEEAMVGTGPFIVTQFRSQQDVKLARNPAYFKPHEPLLDGWMAPLLFENPTAWRLAFLQKQVDEWTPSDPSLASGVLGQHQGVTHEVLSGAINPISLSLNRNLQFKDIRLVKAMNLAVDRRGLIQTFHQGLGQVSGPVPWLQEAYAIPTAELETYPGYGTDRPAAIKRARDLWQAGGGSALGEVDLKVPDTWLALWPDTTQIIPRMFNEALGVAQFKSTRTSYTEEIIPNAPRGRAPNWFGWGGALGSPDPRNALRAGYHTTSGTNHNKVGLLPGDPNLDTMLDEMLRIADPKQAVASVRAVQEVILDQGQFGNIILYNAINRSVHWSYLHDVLKLQQSAGKPALGHNLSDTHLEARDLWLDSKDPSYQGRPPTSL